MASSRIFVKGLPPTFTDPDFRKHFSQNGRTITDAKIFPNRRIGYVGYRTPEDAQKAVKYFNKTFIRMSRIGVELARPAEVTKSVKGGGNAPTAKKEILADEVQSTENTLKRKRDGSGKEKEDPKLKEFLDVMKPKSKSKAWEGEKLEAEAETTHLGDEDIIAPAVAGESDDEYEAIPKKLKRSRSEEAIVNEVPSDVVMEQDPVPASRERTADDGAEISKEQQQISQQGVSDADWARSRTSRLLGLLDDDEEAAAAEMTKATVAEPAEENEGSPAAHDDPNEAQMPIPTPPDDLKDSTEESNKEPVDADIQAVRASMRLFVRNLPYDVQQGDLETEFAPFDNLEEVHIALDKKTGAGKGFAYIQFSDPDSAERALVDRDGQTFQGRLIHVLPAKAKRENKLDDFALSKLPLKKQQEIKRRRDAATSTFNWNALYMNADAVVSSVANRLGLSKSQVLDPTSSDAAIKQAHAETHIIQETKTYFRQQGVDLDSFKKSRRGDTAILVKNIPYDCSKDELKRLFEEQGDVKRFLMPPSGTIAIVEFANATQCKAAFGALAYRKIKSSVLFLEKAPEDTFAAKTTAEISEYTPDGVSKVSATDLKGPEYTVPETGGTATLFVKNLNFSTTTRLLTDTFTPLAGFMSARVKTRTDPKKPGQVLSMGFGFLEFRTAQEAQAALQTMDGYNLEGHKLQVRARHRGADAAEETRKADASKKAATQGTKVIIKNLPFEATKKDVRALFGAYGQLRSVRVPKKMDRGARGFAFADFTTTKEAQSAVEALRDTHLLGRRLILDFAADEPEDAEAEIEKMQEKVGAQVNKVALQKLTSGGRKKFTTQNDEEEG
ncbi:related to RNA-binding (RRM superfamily) [Lecanosticta acicola]|uniref:Multiple RNA-binding domain-containing protein 1 n=1 Tax=Lecanosticta acicola TaxID=111012 RepID=A0AAI8YWA6_9PEZI|nr:related to RNA-binding (RRM superfamily) [Lecanosticta acicola]